MNYCCGYEEKEEIEKTRGNEREKIRKIGQRR
jgi:hypothetical protein